MRKLLIGAMMGLIVLSVSAKNDAFAEDQEAIDACVRAVKAQQKAYGNDQKNIGADYQPGVDVYGRKVAPADLNGGYQIKVPDVIEFPITYDAAKNLGFNGSGLYEGKGNVATVRVEGDKVSINGQEVYSTKTADLIAACRQSRQ